MNAPQFQGSYVDISHAQMASKLPILRTLTKLENESTTRLRAIDTILFEILAWDKWDIETEKYCREGYADYLFLVNNSPTLIVEAKRSGIDFLLSDRVYENRPYLFGILATECPPAAKALQQAIGYAATLGARYVAISNGHQWLLTLSFVPDRPLESRLIYVFESFDAIQSRYQNFWNCFSPEGLKHNAVIKNLLDTLKLPAPAKLSSLLPGYPVPAKRNVFQNELSYILDYVWQVLSQDESTMVFVQNCYVKPSSHEDIEALVRELTEKRKNEDSLLREFEVESIDKLPHNLAHLPAEKPFVVLGEVGRGKSSFLKYLRFVAAKDALTNYIQIDFNFLDRPDNASEIPNFVYQEIERQLREGYGVDINENSLLEEYCMVTSSGYAKPQKVLHFRLMWKNINN